MITRLLIARAQVELDCLLHRILRAKGEQRWALLHAAVRVIRRRDELKEMLS